MWGIINLIPPLNPNINFNQNQVLNIKVSNENAAKFSVLIFPFVGIQYVSKH